MEFSNEFPKPSKIFSQRYELSYVLRANSERGLIKKILLLDNDVVQTNEILSNIYFDQILKYQPEYSYIIRFRQRMLLTDNEFSFPEKLFFEGPGAIEIKKRNLQSEGLDITKTGTFFSRENSIKSLLEKTTGEIDVRHFIEKANANQRAATPSPDLHLIDPNDFAEIANELHLFAARLCLRHSFELPSYENSKITIETNPTFYAFPIMRKAFDKQTKVMFPTGYKTEKASRTKIEIKTSKKVDTSKIYNSLSNLIKTNAIPNNAYTHEPYYKMIVKVSKQNGTLINETEGHEIETKGDISTDQDIKSLMNKIQQRMFMEKNTNYKLFPTEHHVTMRGEAEKNRTIYGWKDSKNNWHEVATIIRMARTAATERGFEAILKWKNDPSSTSFVMDRKTNLEYLKQEPKEAEFIKKLSKLIKRNVQSAGTGRKTKFRIYVQDKDGRNFCVSLDNLFVSKQIQLQQLEVEYVHTVNIGKNVPNILLEQACDDCYKYFSKILEELGVEVNKTTGRKIDFIAS